MNRLADETSPYLRQHADNPVDWYPWGPDAFAAATARDVPLLLSVGYSACHWCHVMAHESFEDPDVAAVMNELFVNVKVDREERPDVDALYMEAVQGLTGHGGWPMTVFLTPTGQPFFGGTYFPKVPRQGMTGFVELLRQVDDAWRSQRGDVLDQAAQLTAGLRRTVELRGDATIPGPAALDHAVAVLRQQYDAAWGGFGRAPKFPQTANHDVLLRAYLRTGDDDLLQMVANTLDAMATGGIYDHLAGGFARYSTDAQWIVPHFEKMLYDQALLVRSYLHVWQLTGKARYRQVLDETIAYVLEQLRHPAGGFLSAEDADSEGEEGRFYVWTPAQVRAVLGTDAADAMAWYGITEAGNFEGKSIPWRPVRGDLRRPVGIEHARERLLASRNLRVRPGLDDKVLTEWNGLMLASLAEAAAATGNLQWQEAAVRNAEFLLATLRRADGRWLRSWQGGDGTRAAAARHLAVAADYAALVDAFTRVGETTGQSRWIGEAVTAADALLELFWDDVNGGVFTTGRDADRLVADQKDLTDDAAPSANSAAAVALLRLGALTGNERYTERAVAIVTLLGELVGRHPSAFGNLLAAVDLLASGVTEVVIPGGRTALTEAAQALWLPNGVLAWGEPFDSPLWADRAPGAAYVCRNYTCELPETDARALKERLAGGSRATT
jgi:uncharacterized protein YyaL (SSP411 family)